MKKNYLLLMLTFVVFSVGAQTKFYDASIKKVDTKILQDALNKEEGFTTEDLNNWIVKSDASSRAENSWYYYVNQTYNGIQIRNSIATILVSNGISQVASSTFIKDAGSKISVSTSSISPSVAVNKALAYHDLQVPSQIKEIDFDELKGIYTFSKTEDLYSDIKVQLFYEVNQNNIDLVWNVNLDLKDGSHWWNTRINAVTGDFVSQDDWVNSCNLNDGKNHSGHIHNSRVNSVDFVSAAFTNNQNSNAMVSSYRALPYYIESPNHGDFELIVSPEDPTASPLGWHNDGSSTYTTTRGNNVIAREDQNGNNGNGALTSESSSGLVFDYTYPGPYVAASTYIDAAVTNVFYVSNAVHDIYYQYGFDEASGNFQEDNFANGGTGGDAVNVDAQDGSGINNANFGTPTDGGNPRMQMFLWDVGAYEPLFEVNNTSISGVYPALDNNFDAPGHVVPGAPVTADMVLYEDATPDTSDACELPVNGAQFTGKIVVIRRGSCSFVSKVVKAQNEGAVAVLIVNNAAGEIVMGGTTADGTVTIPAYSLNQADGESIIAKIATETVNATFYPQPQGFVNIDGDFDNGVIAHEYGHGINKRLVGGRLDTSCVSSTESMGEGWADFIGKILLLKNVDNGIALNGTGTFVVGQSPSGTGIRPAPYSGDISNNPMTYQTLIDDNTNAIYTVPHGVGSVWAGILWDLTWDLIAVHGFTDDIYDANGGFGNTIALNLVIEAMKLTPCQPGFETGRDAILQADDVLYGNGVAGSETGANQCIIWSAFARRGVGFSASQGGNGTPFNTGVNSTSDGNAAFDLPPTLGCNPDYLVTVGDDGEEAFCQGEATSATYDFVFNEQNAYDTDTPFVATGLPAGATATFSPTTMKDTGLFSMTISGITAGTSGSFPITVTPGGNAAKNVSVNLEIYPNNPDLTDGDTTYSEDGGAPVSFSDSAVITVADQIDLDLDLPASAFNGTLLWTSPNGTTYTTNTVSFTNITDGDTAIEGLWSVQPAFTNDCPGALGTQVINFEVTIDPLLSVSDFSVDSFKVYPNPTEDTVTISGLTNLQGLSINLIDITGRTLFNEVNIKTIDASRVRIDMSRLSSGTYFITINSDNGKAVKKVIKK